MNMAICLVVVNAENVLAERVLAFSVPWRCFYFHAFLLFGLPYNII